MQQTEDTVQWLAVLDTTVNLAVSVKIQDFLFPPPPFFFFQKKKEPSVP